MRLQRARRQVNGIVLSFDEALDEMQAENPTNFKLISTRHSQAVPLRSAVYDSTSREVTLRLTKPLGRNQQVRVTVHDAVSDVAGNALDGDADGKPGGKYAALAGLYQRISYTDRDGDLVSLAIESLSLFGHFGKVKRATRGMMELVQGPDGDGRWLWLHDVHARQEFFHAQVTTPKNGSSDGRASFEAITGLPGVPTTVQLCNEPDERNCFEVRALAAAVDEILTETSTARR